MYPAVTLHTYLFDRTSGLIFHEGVMIKMSVPSSLTVLTATVGAAALLGLSDVQDRMPASWGLVLSNTVRSLAIPDAAPREHSPSPVGLEKCLVKEGQGLLGTRTGEEEEEEA
ncbi:Frizzled-1 [Manis pentadactyla]|nr:Frizzled-1 [Manis pentadactyla]